MRLFCAHAGTPGTAFPTPEFLSMCAKNRPCGRFQKSIFPDHGLDQADELGLGAVDGVVVVVFGHEPDLAAAAAQDYMVNPDIMPEKNRFLLRLIWLFSSPVRFVTETTARMPAAMGALFVLGAVIAIAHKLAGRQTAIASGWFCLTLTGFLSSGRMVTDEMTLCALTLWSTAIYLYSREKFTCCSSILAAASSWVVSAMVCVS